MEIAEESSWFFGDPTLNRLIGGTPEACIFQFAFGLLLYNMIHVVRGYIAQGQDREPDEISAEKLFDDIDQQLVAWNVRRLSPLRRHAPRTPRRIGVGRTG